MPGYLPFAGALKLPGFTCDNCGFWQRHFATPLQCPMCLDARHVVPQTGWRFLSEAQAQEEFPCHWEELEPGVWRFWNDPVTGIGPSAYLIRTDHGNMGFEGCPVFSAAALDKIAALGGMQMLSSSHPHAYGALPQLQDRFDPELCLPAADFIWSAALQVSWPYDDFLEPLPGLELHRTAGHFDGHAVLFDRNRRICFCGDAFKFELDPENFRRAVTISAHKAFVRGVPLTPNELRRYRDVFERLDFTQTWTPFEPAANCGRPEVLALLDSLLSGRAHAAPVPLESLKV
ncbi:MAG: MBL fold metallo-hydrolase [Microvirga sp.]